MLAMMPCVGVGNMTPAGVRRIRVDINPAVVTKPADHGSEESCTVVWLAATEGHAWQLVTAAPSSH